MNDIAIITLYGGQGGFSLVDPEWFAEANRFTWRINNRGYVVTTLRSRRPNGQLKFGTMTLHRYLSWHIYGRQIIDHKNGCKFDNRVINLRRATHSQNLANRTRPHARNTSGLRGVSFHKAARRWIAVITHMRKRYHLGCFDTPREAASAWNAKAQELFGEFVIPNKI